MQIALITVSPLRKWKHKKPGIQAADVHDLICERAGWGVPNAGRTIRERWGRLGSGMGGLGEWRSRGRGTVAASRPHPHRGIDGTDGGHLSSVYDWLRATGNGGAKLRSSRAPCITSNTED